MIGLIISIMLLGFIVWGIPFFFLQKTHLTPQPSQGFCNTHLVITVKNAEESIEGVVRSLAWQISNKTDTFFLPADVFILDLSSTDQTFLIADKLAKEYPFIHPLNIADYIAFLNGLE